jgi:hypothetical protein
MTANRASLHLAWVLPWLASFAAATAYAAKPPPPLELRSGARIGLISVLDAEVTHFHAAAQVIASSLKTQPVGWRVDLMLGAVLQAPLAGLGLTAVALPPGEAVSGLREECFLDANLTKPLSKQCAAPYAAIAIAQHLDAIIVLGPGLNNALHADSTRRKELPDYLRGWCVLTDGRSPASLPTLLNLTEMLLIVNTPQGAVLAARDWGGVSSSSWTGFTPGPDPKQLGNAQLEQLQPLFEAMVRSQAQRLLEHVHVAR